MTKIDLVSHLNNDDRVCRAAPGFARSICGVYMPLVTTLFWRRIFSKTYTCSWSMHGLHTPNGILRPIFTVILGLHTLNCKKKIFKYIYVYKFITDRCSRGCSTINSIIHWFSDPLVKISSKHCPSQTERARELKF